MTASLVQPRLTGLTVYPIKGAVGISFTSAELDSFGLRLDRRWMVVDRDGVFISHGVASPRRHGWLTRSHGVR